MLKSFIYSIPICFLALFSSNSQAYFAKIDFDGTISSFSKTINGSPSVYSISSYEPQIGDEVSASLILDSSGFENMTLFNGDNNTLATHSVLYGSIQFIDASDVITISGLNSPYLYNSVMSLSGESIRLYSPLLEVDDYILSSENENASFEVDLSNYIGADFGSTSFLFDLSDYSFSAIDMTFNQQTSAFSTGDIYSLSLDINITSADWVVVSEVPIPAAMFLYLSSMSVLVLKSLGQKRSFSHAS